MIPIDASVGCDASARDVDSGAACHGDEDGGVLGN
jgi:hypothetical protein